MASDIIRKQVEEIQGQWIKGLQELSIITLLLLIPIFICDWFGALILHHASFALLPFDVIIGLVSIVFLIGILWYFWRLRDTPQFHVLFIERKEEQKQSDTKQFLTLFLIPAGLSIGLAFTILSYGLYTSYWPYWWYGWLHGRTLWLSPGQIFLSFYPLIVVVCSSIGLFYAYHIKPERIQKNVPWLLFIPLISSIFIEFFNSPVFVPFFPLPKDFNFYLQSISSIIWYSLHGWPSHRYLL